MHHRFRALIIAALGAVGVACAVDSRAVARDTGSNDPAAAIGHTRSASTAQDEEPLHRRVVHHHERERDARGTLQGCGHRVTSRRVPENSAERRVRCSLQPPYAATR